MSAPRGSVPGGAGIPACTEADPPWERWLLLRMVHILLECILVFLISGGSRISQTNRKECKPIVCFTLKPNQRGW